MSATNGNGKATTDVLTLNEAAILFRHVLNSYRPFPPRGNSSLINGPGAMRNVDVECHFPVAPTIETYQQLYDRNPFAARVVEVYPNACWAKHPEVYERERSSIKTAFEMAWAELDRSLAVGPSWHKAASPGGAIFAKLKEADVRSGIGCQGGLLFGLDDVRGEGGLRQEVDRSAPRKLLYLRPLSESEMTVSKWDTDPASPRYNHPLEYSITEAGPHAGQSLTVHHSRILLIPSEPNGLPRMKQVLNNLISLMYILAGNSEGYWKACIPTTVISSGLGEAGDVDVDGAALKDMLEQIREGTKRDMLLKQLTASLLAPTVPDPTPHVAAHVQAICVKLEAPQRIFLGSERGELASDQDADSWAGRYAGRQDNHCCPSILWAFINHAIWCRLLPEPESGYYHAGWSRKEALPPAVQADVAGKRMTAIGAFTALPPGTLSAMDFWTREMGESQEDAAARVEAAKAAATAEIPQLNATTNAFCPGGDLNSCPPRPGLTGKSHPYTVAEVEQMSRKERRQLARLMGLTVTGRPDRHLRAELLARSRERGVPKEPVADVPVDAAPVAAVEVPTE